MQNFQYKIGFSLKEFNQISDKEFDNNEIKNLLSKKGFRYKKVIVGETLRKTIPICMNAVYKNPSSMRFDAPREFSCSSLVSYLYTQAGVWMPSLSVDKYVFSKRVDKKDLKFGDLIFSNTGNGKIRYETVEWKEGTRVPEGIDHVGIYLDNNKILHATKKIGKVVIEAIEEVERSVPTVGYGRITDMNEERFVVSIPDNRNDLRNKENLVAEIMKR